MTACGEAHWSVHYPLLLLFLDGKQKLKTEYQITSHHESLNEHGSQISSWADVSKDST